MAGRSGAASASRLIWVPIGMATIVLPMPARPGRPERMRRRKIPRSEIMAGRLPRLPTHLLGRLHITEADLDLHHDARAPFHRPDRERVGRAPVAVGGRGLEPVVGATRIVHDDLDGGTGDRAVPFVLLLDRHP